MSQILTYTRWRLRQWGKWSRHEMSGWPSVSPMFRLFSGGSGHDQEPPKEVMEVDGIIRRADPEDKRILIAVHCAGGSLWEKARKIGLRRNAFLIKLERAEWFVHANLEGSDG